MAALTPRPEIVRIAVFWFMVEMGDGKHHPGASLRMRLPVLRSALRVSRRTLAAIVCRRPNGQADPLPIRRISSFVFWPDWHRATSRFNPTPPQAFLQDTYCNWQCVANMIDAATGDTEMSKSDFTTNDIRDLAEMERKMDSGAQPFVVEGGMRWSVMPEAMEELGLVSGQNVSSTIITAILRAHVAIIQSKIAMEKLTKPTH